LQSEVLHHVVSTYSNSHSQFTG